ncbi:hypothetical protein LTR22_026918, partial [Elasticomyces elasticus]
RKLCVLSIEATVGSMHDMHVLLQQRDGVLAARLLLYDWPSGQEDALPRTPKKARGWMGVFYS